MHSSEDVSWEIFFLKMEKSHMGTSGCCSFPIDVTSMPHSCCNPSAEFHSLKWLAFQSLTNATYPFAGAIQCNKQNSAIPHPDD
jgi:hypothetical protein